ncbi:hypothetical protein EPI10_025016 [Gossypium australe]|uniref:Uncharacterized protein n=1 Tax=Gossypium australe TaxID=47621 RepID=A0A5B6W0Q1_9ROSI|nr:hypothetical protein EPI10_025016 [Gossypium australe]
MKREVGSYPTPWSVRTVVHTFKVGKCINSEPEKTGPNPSHIRKSLELNPLCAISGLNSQSDSSRSSP